MDGISGTSSRARDYSYEELQEMQKDTSTSDIMNKAHHDAGYKDDVELRGDDKSTKELHATHKEAHVGPELGATAEELVIHAAPEVVEHGSAGAAAAILAPLVFAGKAIAHVHQDWLNGKERSAAHAKDEARLALHGALNLPPGFKTKELARCEQNNSSSAGRLKVTAELEGKDSKYKATLQMHCDRGQHAALEVLKTGAVKPGMTSEMLLKERPNMAAAYKQDAAFRAGFDGILWAKANSPKEFEASVKSLGERDAGYAKNHIRVQG